MKVKEAEALNPRNMTESLDVELQTLCMHNLQWKKLAIREADISSNKKGRKK
jgi:hypothetical protein